MEMTGYQSTKIATALQLACKLPRIAWPIVGGIASSIASTASATQVV